MDTRAALLDSAEKFCRRRGFDGFSYADLSKEVGIRKASIHHHFPTKADLASAVIEHYSTSFFEKIEQISKSGGSAGSQLQSYIAIYRSALKGGDAVCLCVAFSAGRDSLAEPVLKQLKAFHDRSITWLANLFRSAQGDGSINDVRDPAAEANACLALVEGGQLMARAACDVTLFDRSVQSLLDRTQ